MAVKRLLTRQVTARARGGVVGPVCTLYDSYSYEADLAAGATYTPPANTKFQLFSEATSLSDAEIHVEWYTTVGWMNYIVSSAQRVWMYQSASQRLRVANGAGAAAFAIGVYGETSGGTEGTYSEYSYEASLAAGGATYTMPAATKFCWEGAVVTDADINLEWFDNVNALWRIQLQFPNRKCWCWQPTAQRLRLINDDAANPHRIGLYGETRSTDTNTQWNEFTNEQDLAAGGNYTPPAGTKFCWMQESAVASTSVHLEWYNTAAWQDSIDADDEKYWLYQATNQRWRLYNASVGAQAIGVYGETSGGTQCTYTEYEYEANLAAGATYTPPVSTKFCWFTQWMGATNVNLEWYDNVNGVWRCRIDDRAEEHWLYQNANQRLRLINDSAAASRTGLYGESRS